MNDDKNKEQITEYFELFFHVFDNLPFPIALFKKSGIICMANRLLIEKSGIIIEEVIAGNINLFNRITDDNYLVLEAIENTFLGKTIYLPKLVCPLSIFCRDENQIVTRAYKSAVFFPVVQSKKKVAIGAVMFMR